MRHVLSVLCLLASLAWWPAVAAAVDARPADSSLSSYKLGSGDVISVQVFGEEDLSIDKVRLSDAGTILYPVLGEIRVLGLTIGELEQVITKGLTGRYLVNPKVSVTVAEYRQFFVIGFVEKPGGYAYIPGLTVRKAISVAGGFKERASKDKIEVIRDGDPEQKSKRVSQDDLVYPGDILTVEESFF